MSSSEPSKSRHNTANHSMKHHRKSSSTLRQVYPALANTPQSHSSETNKSTYTTNEIELDTAITTKSGGVLFSRKSDSKRRRRLYGPTDQSPEKSGLRSTQSTSATDSRRSIVSRNESDASENSRTGIVTDRVALDLVDQADSGWSRPGYHPLQEDVESSEAPFTVILKAIKDAHALLGPFSLIETSAWVWYCLRYGTPVIPVDLQEHLEYDTVGKSRVPSRMTQNPMLTAPPSTAMQDKLSAVGLSDSIVVRNMPSSIPVEMADASVPHKFYTSAYSAGRSRRPSGGLKKNASTKGHKELPRGIAGEIACWAQYAAAVYCKDIVSFARAVGIPPADVVAANFKSSHLRPAYVVCIDRVHEAVVIAIRGTRTGYDVLTDMAGADVELRLELLARSHSDNVAARQQRAKRRHERQGCKAQRSDCPVHEDGVNPSTDGDEGSPSKTLFSSICDPLEYAEKKFGKTQLHEILCKGRAHQGMLHCADILLGRAPIMDAESGNVKMLTKAQRERRSRVNAAKRSIKSPKHEKVSPLPKSSENKHLDESVPPDVIDLVEQDQEEINEAATAAAVGDQRSEKSEQSHSDVHVDKDDSQNSKAHRTIEMTNLQHSHRMSDNLKRTYGYVPTSISRAISPATSLRPSASSTTIFAQSIDTISSGDRASSTDSNLCVTHSCVSTPQNFSAKIDDDLDRSDSGTSLSTDDDVEADWDELHPDELHSLGGLGAIAAELCAQFPSYRLMLVGHSLGGGVAALLTMKLLFSNNMRFTNETCRKCAPRHWSDVDFQNGSEETSRDTFDPISEDVSWPFQSYPLHCYCFGVPPVVSDDLGKVFAPFITSLVLGDDMIPRLSLHSMAAVRNAASYTRPIWWREFHSQATNHPLGRAGTAVASAANAGFAAMKDVTSIVLAKIRENLFGYPAATRASQAAENQSTSDTATSCAASISSSTLFKQDMATSLQASNVGSVTSSALTSTTQTSAAITQNKQSDTMQWLYNFFLSRSSNSCTQTTAATSYRAPVSDSVVMTTTNSSTNVPSIRDTLVAEHFDSYGDTFSQDSDENNDFSAIASDWIAIEKIMLEEMEIELQPLDHSSRPKNSKPQAIYTDDLEPYEGNNYNLESVSPSSSEASVSPIRPFTIERSISKHDNTEMMDRLVNHGSRASSQSVDSCDDTQEQYLFELNDKSHKDTAACMMNEETLVQSVQSIRLPDEVMSRVRAQARQIQQHFGSKANSENQPRNNKIVKETSKDVNESQSESNCSVETNLEKSQSPAHTPLGDANGASSPRDVSDINNDDDNSSSKALEKQKVMTLKDLPPVPPQILFVPGSVLHISPLDARISNYGYTIRAYSPRSLNMLIVSPQMWAHHRRRSYLTALRWLAECNNSDAESV